MTPRPPALALPRVVAALAVALLVPTVAFWIEWRWTHARSMADRARELQKLAQGTADARDPALSAARSALARDAVALDPSDSVTAFQAGMVLFGEGQSEEAGRLMLRVLPRFAHPGPGQRLALRALGAAGLAREAAPAARGLLLLTPEPKALGGQLFWLAARALDADGDNARAWSALLEAMSFGDYRDQAAYDLAALAGAAGHREVQFHFLVRSLLDAGRPEAVILAADKWYLATRDDASLDGFVRLALRRNAPVEALLQLAVQLLDAGAAEGAERIAATVERERPPAPEPQLLRALIAAKQGRTAEALALVDAFLSAEVTPALRTQAERLRQGLQQGAPQR